MNLILHYVTVRIVAVDDVVEDDTEIEINQTDSTELENIYEKIIKMTTTDIHTKTNYSHAKPCIKKREALWFDTFAFLNRRLYNPEIALGDFSGIKGDLSVAK